MEEKYFKIRKPELKYFILILWFASLGVISSVMGLFAFIKWLFN